MAVWVGRRLRLGSGDGFSLVSDDAEEDQKNVEELEEDEKEKKK